MYKTLKKLCKLRSKSICLENLATWSIAIPNYTVTAEKNNILLEDKINSFIINQIAKQN